MGESSSVHSADAKSLTSRLKAKAIELGIGAVGIAPAVAPPGYDRFTDWLDAGYAAGMVYMHTHREARGHPGRVLEGVRSLVVGLISYNQPAPACDERTEGRVARYAQGSDYHRVVWDRFDRLLDWLTMECPGVRGRSVVDTAPLLERDFARLAGLGWIAKNTMLINKSLGSYTFIGTLLVDCELEPDQPFAADHCGSCTRCLDACPTQAFPTAGVLDAGRCISYLTIEHRGSLPEAMADQLHGWVFGCDICQEVCPWNRKPAPTSEPELLASTSARSPDLVAWLQADPDVLRQEIRGSALKRAKPSRLLRNAALILGTCGVDAARDALIARLDDDDPVVRDSAAWALQRLGTPSELDIVEHPEASENNSAERSMGPN